MDSLDLSLFVFSWCINTAWWFEFKLKPDFMIQGTDWREGPLSEVRVKAINLMKTWGGQVIEPEYTKGVSSSGLKKRIQERE